MAWSLSRCHKPSRRQPRNGIHPAGGCQDPLSGSTLADAVRDNLVTGRIVTSRPHPGGRVLHLALPNLHEIEVRHAATTYAPLGLQVGDEVRLSLRRDALVVISR